jgi:hypothetical protein
MNAERTDFIAEAITEAFGSRCPDYAEGCAACDAWKQRDDMLSALEPFAAVAEHDIGQDEDDADLFQVMSERNARAPRLTVGHLRSARAAIARARGDQS